MLTSNLIKKCQSIISIENFIPSIEFKMNTDSRTFKKGEVFVALGGENFDGFTYADSVLKTGAAAIIFSARDDRKDWLKLNKEKYSETIFIESTDSLKCIQELASKYILEWKSKNSTRKIIGITGSNGKTTHKEMVYFLLNSVFPNKVLATKGNFNNHIGVPLTIFRLEEHHEIAVIEMGMNHQGEIKELCEIAHPECGMITNVGPAHIEFMKSMENIFNEKATLYREVVKNTNGTGKFVVNADDQYLVKLEKTNGLVTYGEKTGDVRIKMNENGFSFHIDDKSVLIANENIFEHHNLKNLAGTLIFTTRLFPEKINELSLAASHYQQPSMNRSEWKENIFLDAYNANPASMKVSLDSFIDFIQRKKVSLSDCYFVIGDMNELGDFAPELHKEIAEYIRGNSIQNVSFIGRYKDFYLNGFPNPKSSYLKKEEFYYEWKEIRKKYKYIFVKASRSLQLETLISIF